MNITLAIGSRANWGSCRAVVERLRQEHNVHAICYGTSILERYGDVSKRVAGWCNVTRIATHVPGGTPPESVTECGATLERIGAELERQRPDLVYVVGDRYEVLPAAYAAHLLGLKLAQQMPGEISGTIDDKTRHAITQLADWHFCATEKAKERTVAMLPEGPHRVFHTGCPRIDIAARAKPMQDEPYIVVMMHPDVTEWQSAGEQMRAVLDGVNAAWDGKIHLWWPNADAGHEAIVNAVREARRTYITHRSMDEDDYYALLAGARCAVGNSSSFLREGSFLGVPVVLVGDRQRGRELALNCVTDHNGGELRERIAKALTSQRPKPSTLYGDGTAGEKIAEALRCAS